jgi:transposase InsO family protein
MKHVDVSAPLDAIAIDIMAPLPVTENGNQYIMVVGDYFSKWTEAYPLPMHTALIVADKLVTEFICRYGAPLRIHTDQGRGFESHLFAELCNLLEITKSRTTPYRPQSDGMIELFNRTLQQMLAMFVNENHNDWDHHLPY